MGLQLREPWRTLFLSPMGNGLTSDPNIPGGIDAGNHVAVKGYTRERADVFGMDTMDTVCFFCIMAHGQAHGI